MMGPLSGISLVTTALNVPGPVAARRLADLGMRVLKIEPPHGDELARRASALYADLHAGCEVMRLDLRDPADIERVHDRVHASDLLLTSQRSRVLDRLGLSWSALHERHDRVCHVEIVGYPPPNADRPGHDLTYLAHVGLLDPPRMPRTLAADLAGAERVAQAALSLLLARERTGNSDHTVVALADIARDLALPLRYGLTTAAGPLGGGDPGYGLYQGKEGWVALGAYEPHFHARVRSLLGVDARGDLAPVFATRTARAWEVWAQENDVPLAAATNPWTDGHGSHIDDAPDRRSDTGGGT